MILRKNESLLDPPSAVFEPEHVSDERSVYEEVASQLLLVCTVALNESNLETPLVLVDVRPRVCRAMDVRSGGMARPAAFFVGRSLGRP